MESAGIDAKNWMQKYAFAVEVNGFTQACFEKINLPTVEFDEVEFNPAGSTSPQKFTGRVKFGDIEFTKGTFFEGSEKAVVEWLTKQTQPSRGTLGFPKSYMKDVEIHQYNPQGSKVRTWKCKGCFIKKAAFGDLEGGSSDVVIETITMGVNWIDLESLGGGGFGGYSGGIPGM